MLFRSMFASQILADKPHLPLMTNHPKQGGIASFLGALGALSIAGIKVHWPDNRSSELSEAFRAGPIEAHHRTGVNQTKTTEPSAESLHVSTSLDNSVKIKHTPASTDVVVEVSLDEAINNYLGDLFSPLTGYPARFCNGMVSLRDVLGLTDQTISQVVSSIARDCITDQEYDVSQAKTASDLARFITKPPASYMTSISSSNRSTKPSNLTISSVNTRKEDPVVITGISLGLPGGEKVFSEDTFERLVRGETCIKEVSNEYKQRLLDKNIVRLIKGRDGSVNMEQATQFDDIPQLAGIKSSFDIAEEFGIDPKVAMAWDITTQLSVAAGLLALRDAGIPLTPVEQTGKGGLRLITNWQVPQVQRDRTGIIFASCFPGLQMAMKHAKNNGDDGEGRFDRRFLFQTLNMGHSQFAQYTGIRGPNTTVNLACASATAAFGVAEDWIKDRKSTRLNSSH